MTGDSGTFLGSFLSLFRAVNVIFMLVLGKRKQHLEAEGGKPKQDVSEGVKTATRRLFWRTGQL